MKCPQCTGHLNPRANACPYCGSRVEADLKSGSFRDLGPKPDLPCPECKAPLNVLEFDTTPPVEVERCNSCLGTFFNPGEVELLLQHFTTEVLWIDYHKLRRLEKEIEYKKRGAHRACPVCGEQMSKLNFGSSRGIVIDSCDEHGLWIQNDKIKQLTEWWRAGGKILYEDRQRAMNRQLSIPPKEEDTPPKAAPKSKIPVVEEPSPWSLRGLLADFLCLFDE